MENDNKEKRVTVSLDRSVRAKLMEVRYLMSPRDGAILPYNVVIERLHAMYMKQGGKANDSK